MLLQVLEDKNAIYLNTEDPQKSNWLRYMRPAPEKERRNITLLVKDKKLFFVSIVDIPDGGELLYWADDHITSWSKKKILKSSMYFYSFIARQTDFLSREDEKEINTNYTFQVVEAATCDLRILFTTEPTALFSMIHSTA